MDPQQAASTTPAGPELVVSEGEKAHVKQWSKRIEAASNRSKLKFTRFKRNRKLLAGENVDKAETTDPETQSADRTRANLHFANMAALLPQVYAKDPEFTCQPTQAVPPDKAPLIKQFAITCERMLTKCVVKDANLKRNSKKMLRSAYATSIGWWKASWQENTKTDPIILNRIKDTQDNIDRIQALLKDINDETSRRDHETQVEELKQALAGLETQQEVVVSRGPTLDFVMAEDILLIDPSIRTITDYQRAGALAMRVWMTAEQFEARYKRKPAKAKVYSEVQGEMSKDAGGEASLLCVWEIWSQDDNRIYTWCEGEEGWARQPYSPDWTGKRWYPFFGGAFNEVDGQFYPLSDVELTEKLVNEYNKNREDMVRDRQDTLPITLFRAGGDITDEVAKNIRNRQGNQMIAIKGVPGKPIDDDIKPIQLGQLNPTNYDTAPARQDMEMVLGGGDASRGAVLKAKTATEAEIVSQGLRGRSAERQDTMEDVLNELGPYMLEMMLRKFSEAEVKALVGEDALWPTLSIEEIFNLVNVEVRGGSTGKPDRLQEQDRWIKLMPIIKDTITAVADLREKGQDALAEAIIELTRETLRRFDERLDIEQFLPPKPEGEDDPAVMKQMIVTLKQQLEQAMNAAKQAKEEVEKGYVSAAASIATSANPMLAAQAFVLAMQTVQGVEQGLDNPIPPGMPSPAPQMPPGDGSMPPEQDPATTAAPPLQ